MTEQEIKEACKIVIEHGNRNFTDAEKKLLKQAVDQSRNLQELLHHFRTQNLRRL